MAFLFHGSLSLAQSLCACECVICGVARVEEMQPCEKIELARLSIFVSFTTACMGSYGVEISIFFLNYIMVTSFVKSLSLVNVCVYG